MNILPRLFSYVFSGSWEDALINGSDKSNLLPIDQLTNDIIIEIFKNLSSNELINIRLVSKKWKKLIQNQSFKLDAILYLINSRAILEALLKRLSPTKPISSYYGELPLIEIRYQPSIYEGKFLNNLILIKGITKEEFNKPDFTIKATWQQGAIPKNDKSLFYSVVRTIEITPIPSLTLEKKSFLDKLKNLILAKVNEINRKEKESKLANFEWNFIISLWSYKGYRRYL